MRRTLFILSTSFIFLACGGKSKTGTQVAQEVCDCSKKANALATSDPDRSMAQADCLKQQGEAWLKIKDDKEKADEFNTGLKKCTSEQINKSFGK
jgi:hypothetical protein